ncbi:MAG: sigma-54-dependent Fis family transcriptional regulator, partial [Victivallales bacterium]|nr:sigma-54-dependent Fis family transcriptional regulator [Victivallales bacterium]
MLLRITLALDNGNVSRKLAMIINRDQEFILSYIRTGKDIVRIMAAQETDLLLVSRARLGDDPLDFIAKLKSLPDFPSVVVIGENNPHSRAELLGAGFDSVLEGNIPLDNIAEAILGQISIIMEQKREHYGLQPERIHQLRDFISNSGSMQAFMTIVRKIIRKDSSLLILGETGSGKEHLARAIHNESHRADQPFIPVHCAAIPETLLESELFGHERGAFTGATRSRRGAFELAHGGTLFLDEIGDIPIHLQTKLLRVLQDRAFSRLGGEKNIRVDVRIMAATSINLQNAIESGEFRSDLYYRLSVITLNIPPLRKRREDIPDLAHEIIRELNRKTGTPTSEITDSAMSGLVEYSWPGNVRELRNVLERALLLSEDDTICANDFPEEISGGSLQSSLESIGDILKHNSASLP